MAREREVRVALRDALMATEAFTSVFLSGLPEDFGFGASLLTAAVIEPGPARLATGWEAGAMLGGIAYDAACTVTLLARHEDPQIRDELAESLLDVLADVAAGPGVSSGAIPGRTSIISWVWMPAENTERRIQATVGFTFLATGLVGGTTSANPFPLSAAHQIWDLLCNTLKADPILSASVRHWETWRGDLDLTEPASLFDINHLPAVRLTPMAAPGEWMDEESHKFRWPIRVDLDVPGSDARVAMDFYEAFAKALFTGNTLLNQMVPLKVQQKTLSSASYEPRRYTDGSGFRASGLLSLLIWIDS